MWKLVSTFDIEQAPWLQWSAYDISYHICRACLGGRAAGSQAGFIEQEALGHAEFLHSSLASSAVQAPLGFHSPTQRQETLKCSMMLTHS